MSHNSAPGRSRTASEFIFILASGSPRRRELLAFLDIPFTIILPEAPKPASSPATATGGIDETPRPGEPPPELVQRLSRDKALAVAGRLPPQAHKTTVIIAADTVVVLKDKILGKPTHRGEATQMLIQLRQQQYHYVYSGLTLAVVPPQPLSSEPGLITHLHQSKVWMRPYTEAEIEAYVDSGDPLDKAGAYAIQSKSFDPVEQLEGCFASVMGLPLSELISAFQEIGLSFPHVSQHCTAYSGYPCCLDTIPNA